ncbi:MAG: Arylsulfatase [Bryobacteraceae bacterium]|nr:Arylsulfatase [Bryobacteraceae bacterium]
MTAKSIERPSRRALLPLALAPVVLPSRAAMKSRPNLLFVLSSQHRHDWVGASKSLALQTPNLDLIARTGVRFTRVVSASPMAGPSRACLASGRDYWRCGVRGNAEDYPLDQPTFYQSLREVGYRVASCGTLELHKATLDWGIDGRRFLPEWGFTDGFDSAGKMKAVLSGAVEARDPYMAYLHSRGLAVIHVEDYRRRMGLNGYLNTDACPLPAEAYYDNWVAAEGLNLLRSLPRNRPWFLQLGFPAARNPLDTTRRMQRLQQRRTFPQPVDSEQYTPERHVAIRRNYSAIVENIDRLLGLFLEEIRERGETENTYVIYSSDHGEMLGDHERWAAGMPYRPSVSVPLYVRGPGVRSGVVCEELVSHHDLAATILELASAPRLHEPDSRGLRALLEGRVKTHREFVRSAFGRWRMICDGRYKLIRGFDMEETGKRARNAPEPKPVLFDLKLDPEEVSNSAREYPDQVQRLMRLL